MTTEQLKQTAAAMLDAAAGKIIQCRNPNYPDLSWSDLHPRNASWEFTLNEYRPKPEPVSRPWNCPADVPVGACYVRRVGSPNWGSVVMSANEYGMTGIGRFAWEPEMAACVGRIPWSALNTYEYSTDRKTWHPCTVTEPSQ